MRGALLAALLVAASIGCTASPPSPRFDARHPASPDAAESPLPERSRALAPPAPAERSPTHGSMGETP